MTVFNSSTTRLRFPTAIFSFVVVIAVFTSTPELRAQGSPLRIMTPALPSAITNTAYSFTMNGDGGTTPYAWNASGLPPAFSINSGTGRITGTATSPGSFSVTVTVTDNAMPTHASASKTFSFNVVLPLSITTSSLPAGTVNV